MCALTNWYIFTNKDKTMCPLGGSNPNSISEWLTQSQREKRNKVTAAVESKNITCING